MRDSALARAMAFVERERVLRRGERVLVVLDSDVRSAALSVLIARTKSYLGLRAAGAIVVQPREDEDDATGEAARYARHVGLEVTVCQSEDEVVAVARSVLRERGWERLALADTVEDAAARVLRECVEGRLLRGLCARRADGVSRPLLESSLRDADEIARDAGLATVNVPPELERAPTTRDDRVRDGILQRIRAEFPAVDRSLLRLAERSRRAVRKGRTPQR